MATPMHRDAPLPLEGRRCFGRKMSNSGDRARRRPHTRPLGFPGSRRNSLEPPPTVGYILPPTGVALSSAIMSISTHAPNGTCATLTALRAWMPRSPNTWTSSSDAASATRWGSVKFGAPLAMTKSFTTRRTLSRSPTAALSTASNSIATPRAATLPSSRLIYSPTFPRRGLPSFLPRRPDS
jgi:hypothetical protein